MNKISLVISLILFTALSHAEMTKDQILNMAANTVISTGHAALVEGCNSITSSDELFLCVKEQSQMSSLLHKATISQVLKGKHKVSYFDGSGDCTLVIDINAATVKVENKEVDWVCE